MKPNFKQIADDVRNLNRMFQSLARVGQAIDEIGTVEQAADEANARAEKARRTVTDLLAQVEALNGELNTAKAAIESAKQAAAKIVAEANAQAESILSEAKAGAEATAHKAAALVQEANDSIFVANDQRDSVIADLGAKRQELDALNASIAEIKSQLAKFVG